MHIHPEQWRTHILNNSLAILNTKYMRGSTRNLCGRCKIKTVSLTPTVVLRLHCEISVISLVPFVDRSIDKSGDCTPENICQSVLI